MKRVNPAVRVLGFLADYIIAAFPVIFIMMLYFQISDNQAQMLFQMLFALYGALWMEYRKGATIGKYFGRIQVVTVEDTTPSLLEYGIRELIKALYFIPYAGWLLGLVSFIMLFIKRGMTIHDYASKTKVIYKPDILG